MALTKVTLRKREISNGKTSLYLDFYPSLRNMTTMKKTRRQSLGIYIYTHPKNQFEKDFNKEMLTKAEVISASKQKSIINEEYGFIDHQKLKMNFLDFLKSYATKKNEKYTSVYKHFSIFSCHLCTFEDLTLEFCLDFKEYLLKANTLKSKKQKLSQNSASAYYNTFRYLLKIAYKKGYLFKSIHDKLEPIAEQEVRIEYLTEDELKILCKTECDTPILKQASLFSCLTGLRISDILKLEWSDIVIAPDGGPCLRIRTQKTKTEALLPLSHDAVAICGVRSSGKVFKGFQRSMTQAPLKKWIEATGINKHVTFHCFRHTFASLLAVKGVNLFLIQELMTHSRISSTQRYTKVSNYELRNVANLLTL